MNRISGYGMTGMIYIDIDKYVHNIKYTIHIRFILLEGMDESR